jgi:hypothetical protein
LGTAATWAGSVGVSSVLRAVSTTAACRSNTRWTASRRSFSRCQRSATCSAWEAPSVAARG